jgi:Fe-S-cluster containining protein
MDNDPMGRPEASSTTPEIRSIPIVLDLPEGRIEAEVDLPMGPERLVVLAFKMLAISTEVADMATEAARGMGLEVSCKKGCGACCRQLVPLSPPEAAMIFEFVASMPEPRKHQTEKGFSVALKRLKKRGVFERLEQLHDPLISDEAYQGITEAYFDEHIPCPFLVDECCSIHEVRPSMCREYLVSSPAENCRSPLGGEVLRLPISVRLSEALARTWASLSKMPVMVIPLINALEWTREHVSTRSMGGDSLALLTTLVGHMSDIVAERKD